MAVGRFIAMVGMLVWRRSDGRYLLLRRSPTRDFAPGEWETGSGRLEQGEGFIDAASLSVSEEHSEHRWVTAEEATAFLPPDHWLSALITRAEAFRELMPVELRNRHWDGDLES